MFTGLVEKVATLARIDKKGREATMRFDVALDGLELGESISCSGVCLTVTRFDTSGFEADVSMETLAVTTLGALPRGGAVNIERACRAGDRLGGHLVLGHVDGVGRVRSLSPVEDAWRFVVDAPPALARFFAPKGSVAVDGVSLTINVVHEPSGFEIMLVPHTLAVTTLGRHRAGDAVNIEIDVLARYVARQLEHAGVTGAGSRDARLLDTLARGGFLDDDGSGIG